MRMWSYKIDKDCVYPDTEYFDEFAKWAKVIAKYREFPLPQGKPTAELASALAFFGLCVSAREHSIIDEDHPVCDVVNIYTLTNTASFRVRRPEEHGPEELVPKFRCRDDEFSAHLADLRKALGEMSSYIKTINDPTRLTTEVKAVRVFIDSFSELLAGIADVQPEEIPPEFTHGLATRILRIDWIRFSERADKLATHITALIKILF